MSQLGPLQSVTKWLRTQSVPLYPKTLPEAFYCRLALTDHPSGVQDASLQESTMTGRRAFYRPRRHLLARVCLADAWVSGSLALPWFRLTVAPGLRIIAPVFTRPVQPGPRSHPALGPAFAQTPPSLSPGSVPSPGPRSLASPHMHLSIAGHGENCTDSPPPVSGLVRASHGAALSWGALVPQNMCPEFHASPLLL